MDKVAIFGRGFPQIILTRLNPLVERFHNEHMEIAQLLAQLADRGVEFAHYIHQCSRGNRRVKLELSEQLAIDADRIGRYLRLAGDLFNKPSPRRQQAVNIAREGKLSIDTLLVINRATNLLIKEKQELRDDLFHELCTYACHNTLPSTKAYAMDRVRQLNGKVSEQQAWSRRWVRGSKTADASGMRYINAKLPAATAARILTQLTKQAQTLRQNNNKLTHDQAMADAFLSTMSTEGGLRLADEESLTPAFLIPADGYSHHKNQWLVNTAGEKVHASQLAERKLAEFGWAIVYDQNAQPVDLYRTRRFANTKQRLMLTIDQLLCADPDCARPAITGQAHHIQAWKNGGETNLDNLVMTCAQHNAQNDDNPQKPKNGRYIRHPKTGQAAYQPPQVNKPIKTNQYPIAKQSGRQWALEHFARVKTEAP